MPPFSPDPVLFAGRARSAPGILMRHEELWKEVLQPQPAGSIYGISLSPSGTCLAAAARVLGARGELGHVWAWLCGADGTPGSSPVLSCFQPEGATCVTWVDEERFVSGSVGGGIRIWSLQDPRREALSWRGHAGVVFCVASLGDGNFYSVGSDGIARLWDAGSGRLLGEWVLQDTAAASSAIGVVEPAPDLDAVYFLAPSGQVSRLGLGDAGVPIMLFRGVSGMALVGELLVMADSAPSRLRAVHAVSGEERRFEQPLPGPALSLAAVGTDGVAVVLRDGRVKGYQIGSKGFVPWQNEDAEGVRSVTGPSRSILLHERERSLQHDRDRLRHRGEQALAAGSFELARGIGQQMGAVGLRLEGLLLTADAWAAEGLPLRELRYRYMFAQSAPDHPQHVDALFRYALLLESVREPSRARGVLERIVEIDDGCEEAVAGLERLAGSSTGQPPADSVLDAYAGRIDGLLQEVEKLAALEVEWTWKVVVEREERLLARGALSPAVVTAEAVKHLPGWTLATVKLCEVGGEVREGDMLVRSDPVRSWLEFMVELVHGAEGWQQVTRSVVLPVQEGNADAGALELGRRVQEVGAAEARQAKERFGSEAKSAFGRVLGGSSMTTKGIRF